MRRTILCINAGNENVTNQQYNWLNEENLSCCTCSTQCSLFLWHISQSAGERLPFSWNVLETLHFILAYELLFDVKCEFFTFTSTWKVCQLNLLLLCFQVAGNSFGVCWKSCYIFCGSVFCNQSWFASKWTCRFVNHVCPSGLFSFL